MRTFKFRGKRVNRREWVYSTESFVQTDEGICMGLYNEEKDVIPETVGQFTGLHDKNGKEIFEGDIMVIYYNYPGLSFKGIATYERARFIIKQINGDGYTLFSDYGKEQLEVIGNIHDNPELLK